MSKRLPAPVIGQKFGRLEVITPTTSERGGKKSKGFYDLCRCDCGTVTPVVRAWLYSGNTKSCGCLHKEATAAASVTHGHSTAKGLKSKTYRAWRKMRDRCYDSKDQSFANYGARSVRVCDRWLHSYENFLADMGVCPSMKHTLDKDKLGGDSMLYSPETCCWLTMAEQARNKRNNVFVIYNGKRMILMDACKLAGLEYITVWQRRKRGWAEKDWFLPIGSKPARMAKD